MIIDKNATKLEDSNLVRAIKLKDVDSFIVDTLVINGKDEEIFSKEGFVKMHTFTRDNGMGITRRYAVYDRREL